MNPREMCGTMALFRKAAGKLVVGVFMVTATLPAAASERVAIVIGNGHYLHTARLKNPVNDARAIADKLALLGFDVMLGTDLTKDQTNDLLFEFGGKVQTAKFAVAYYAGHAIEVDGVNYILPVDASLRSERHLRHETVPVDSILAELREAADLRIVILDACRDNPLAAQMKRSLGTRSASVGRGLKVVPRADSNTLIAYATQGGAIAEDGQGTHSPFASAILRHIGEAGLEIRRFFGKVRDSVRAATGGRQDPYVYLSLGGDQYFFRPPSGTVAGGGYTPSRGNDRRFWLSIESSSNPALFEEYLQRFPNGRYRQRAISRIAALRRPQRTDPVDVLLLAEDVDDIMEIYLDGRLVDKCQWHSNPGCKARFKTHLSGKAQVRFRLINLVYSGPCFLFSSCGKWKADMSISIDGRRVWDDTVGRRENDAGVKYDVTLACDFDKRRCVRRTP